MYVRKDYINWLDKYLGTPLIKVLVGMRRVGKSTLLQQFKEHLINERGLLPEQILYIDMEILSNRDIIDEITLQDKIDSYFKNSQVKKLLFIDEIQEIMNWERVVVSLLKNRSFDIYITGSNAHLLSSDLATYLAGRYVEMQIYPFSYKEYLEVNGKTEHDEGIFQRYLTYGGFPGLIHLPQEDTIIFQTLDALYNSIILRDIVERYQIRNISLLENLTNFFFDNIGNVVTAKSIVDYLKSQRIKASVESVQTYMGYLAACFALFRTRRYDIKGKRFLEISEKHYLGDLGLRHATLGYRPSDINQLLENVVYLSLRKWGYSVFVGKLDNLEIDFIAEKNQNRLYIQIAYLIASPETRQREFAPLLKVKDSYPKYVLTMDPLQQDESGIRHFFIPDFLLSNNP